MTALTLAEIKRRSGSDDVSLLLHDLSTLAEVRRLADAFKAKHARLDVLVNNAGGVSDKRTVTADGFEWQGRPYRSLSAIARAITGTRWNGPLFFGLANHRRRA